MILALSIYLFVGLLITQCKWDRYADAEHPFLVLILMVYLYPIMYAILLYQNLKKKKNEIPSM